MKYIQGDSGDHLDAQKLNFVRKNAFRTKKMNFVRKIEFGTKMDFCTKKLNLVRKWIFVRKN